MNVPVELSSQGVTVTDRLHDYTERRIDFALRRFSTHIEHVHVRLDRDAKKNDRRCRVQVRMRGMPSIRVTQIAAVEFAAVDSAADRIGHIVGRRLDRRLTPPRGHAAIRLRKNLSGGHRRLRGSKATIADNPDVSQRPDTAGSQDFHLEPYQLDYFTAEREMPRARSAQ